MAHIIDTFLFCCVLNSSWRYFDRKWIELSTDIPKAILKTITVLGLSGMPRKPIAAAVKRSGIRFGNMESSTI